MNDILGWIVTAAALAVGLLCLVAAIRDRPPHLSHYAGVALVEVLALVLTVVAVIAMIGGDHPAEVGTFIGYLFTFLALPPVAIALARLEPTRWGSVILTVAMLVMPVLVARLNQIWEATGA